MGKISKVKITKMGKKVCVDFQTTSDLDFFWREKSFFSEYDVFVESVPDSIAIIPFVCSVLPIVWLTDTELEIETIDKAFYESIEFFKRGYKKMYPQLSFNGTLTVERVEYNFYQSEKSAMFFSGGADAYASLVAHYDEQPVLMLLRGADVDLDDDLGWYNVSTSVECAANEFGFLKSFIVSNFRSSLNQTALDHFVAKSGDSWWHGFQHGIALIGQAAPLAFLHKFGVVYIASSFTKKDKEHEGFSCASDPTIDNYVRFGSTIVSHDQFEFCRQEKITHICNFVKKTGHKVSLHVCWRSKGGENCCHCEKCYRTIMEIAAENMDPIEFGFACDKNIYKRIKKDICLNMNVPFTSFWQEIQDRFRENRSLFEKDKDFRWIYSIKVKNINRFPLKRLKSFFHKSKVSLFGR